MMNALSLDAINAKASYIVERDEETGTFGFVTDSGVEIVIDFMDDDLIQTDVSYQLVMSNANNRNSHRDKKLKNTIQVIVEEFFDKNQAAILYICETGDGKQAMRSRLFSYWFNAYEYNTRYSMVTTCVPDDEGINNFAALIVRLDNPRLVEIINEFTLTAKMLREK